MRHSNDTRPMTIRKSVALILLAVSLVLGIGWAVISLWKYAGKVDAGPPRGGPTEQLMVRKSAAMEHITDSLVLGDFDALAKAARKMESIAVHAAFYVSNDNYLEEGAQFHDSIKRMIKAANEDDYEAAAMAHAALTASCIDCHRHVLNNRGIAP